MEENIFFVATYMVEAVKYCLGAFWFLEEKLKNKKAYIWTGLFLSFCLILPGPMVTVKNSPVILLAVLCTTFFLLEGTWTERLIKLSLLFIIVINLDEMLSGFTKGLVEALSWQEYVRTYLDSLMGLLLILLMGLLGSRRKKKEQNYNHMYLMVIFCGVVMSLTVGTLNYVRGYILNDRFQLFSAVFIACSYLGIGLLSRLLIKLRRQNDKMRELLEQEKRMGEMQMHYYQQLLEKEEETKKFRHDINNHLLCVKNMMQQGNASSAMEYLKQLYGEISLIRSMVYHTGNELMDIIVNEKLTDLPKDIKVTILGQVGKIEGIEDKDLCTIMANLLDNAKEAVERMEGGHKKIEIRFKSGSRWTEIVVGNSIAEKVEESQLSHSSKKNPDQHGIGLHNVRNTVKKYGGSMEFASQSDLFEVHICLPKYDRSGS